VLSGRRNHSGDFTAAHNFGPAMPIQPVKVSPRLAGLALTIALFLSPAAHAQGAGPFARLAGQWSGSGTIDLANGGRESIKCRASYDVLSEQNNLQLNIRCASESYNFDLRASATYRDGAIGGTWSESTRNASGTLSGRGGGDRFSVLASGPSFSANLTLATHGNRQSVVIKANDTTAGVKGATINLQRGS
jgi:hypothetical protein